MPPIIGITTDVIDPGNGKPLKADCSLAYAQAIAAAGATPLLLPPIPELAEAQVSLCDGFVLSGGDDPRTEAFGVPTHPAAKLIHPMRQAYELRLLDLLRDRQPRTPVLGVCLGMQMMSLHAGGTLNQHMPESLSTADRHRGLHPLRPEDQTAPLMLLEGMVWSNHHQSVQTPGRMRVLASSPDGVIEALADTSRPFYCGVQWHPERTADQNLGPAIFAQLAAAASATRRGPLA